MLGKWFCDILMTANIEREGVRGNGFILSSEVGHFFPAGLNAHEYSSKQNRFPNIERECGRGIGFILSSEVGHFLKCAIWTCKLS